mgnify:FL=1|jgi:hypothetical protein
MQKITFEDTQVAKKPYVTINETEYEVQDGTYTGGTDLNATTFNNMQDNIESAIDENTNNIGDLSGLVTTNKASTTEAINETYNKINKVYNAKGDGASDGVLIAEMTFTKFTRAVLIFATTLVGFTDTVESGIYNIGVSCVSSTDLTTHRVSYSVMGEASTSNIFHISDGANIKFYLKKTSVYRDLKATLLGKSDEISWKLN